MATIKDIAKLTGLSIATISKHINGGHVLEENKLAIDKAIVELDYTVNQFGRALKTKRSLTVGVIIPELSSIFITSIITVVEDELRKKGYGVIICDCRTDAVREREAVDFLVQKQVDGIINMPTSSSGEHLTPALNSEIPIVLIDRMIPQLKGRVSAVLVDNISASAAATGMLMEAGHRNIGILLGPERTFTSQQRLVGYNQVLIENRCSPNDEYIVYSDYTIQGGYEAMKSLLAKKDLTAVFATNYELTLGSIIAFNEGDVTIPDQLSIIGFDNLELARVIKPSLTIITQPIKEIGISTARIMLEHLQNKMDTTPHEIITLSTDIMVGESVGSI